MTASTVVAPNLQRNAPRRSPFRAVRIFARQNPLGALAGIFLIVMLLATILSPVIAPYGIDDQGGPRLTTPSWDHPMGTDQLGRDLFSRVLVGGRASLFVGFGVAVLATSIGTVLGVACAYYRGVFDVVVQRTTDALMALPPIFIALALISAFETSSLFLVIIAIVMASFPRITRIIRSAALTVAQEPYVLSAQAVGASGTRVMFRHIVPNVFPYSLVLATVLLGNAILVETTLSFLGLGVQPPTPSWGGMLSGSVRTYMLQSPWLAFPPGIALTLTVLSFNLFGDALRDHLDPKLRRR
jgi:peptide/nickel transport system permease protein